MPSSSDRARPATRVTLGAEGPLLVEGPVEVVGDDGTRYTSRRFAAAICTCRKTRTYPWCDTSHRRRVRSGPDPTAGEDDRPDGTRATDRPERPEETERPDKAGRPYAAGKRAMTEKRDASGKPDETEKRDVTEKPDETEKRHETDGAA
ncbi:CDGSH iron-sulfur domain-containing protein [Streptomyces sp. cmx-18-6]|uniref:CDGSH iron-sulfur domain-containing protein n=1 Tax=Streptomyces sp. cmx-18-6 TaxID=2790930 RepID=UPI003981263F